MCYARRATVRAACSEPSMELALTSWMASVSTAAPRVRLRQHECAAGARPAEYARGCSGRCIQPAGGGRRAQTTARPRGTTRRSAVRTAHTGRPTLRERRSARALRTLMSSSFSNLSRPMYRTNRSARTGRAVSRRRTPLHGLRAGRHQIPQTPGAPRPCDACKRHATYHRTE